MTIVVLVVLAMVWVAVLLPGLFRRTMGDRSAASIGSFHRQLRVLGRTGPAVVPPAHRLGTAFPGLTHGSGPSPSVGVRRGLVVVRSDAQTASGGDAQVLVVGGPRPGGATAPVRQPDPYRRPGACRRRRDVLIALLCALMGTGLVGAIPGMHLALVATALVLVAFLVYVGLLVRLRMRADERELKLRYLPPPLEHDPSVVVRQVASR